MTPYRLLATTLLAVACTGAVAQGPSANPSAKKELVQKVLQLQQGAVDSIARGLAEQSIAQIAQQATAVLQTRIPAEQREATARDIQAEFKKYGDEVLPLLRERAAKLAPASIGGVLEDKFSEDELKQLVALLESPIHRKYQQTGPDMQKALLEKLVADSRPAVEPKLQALQEAVAKRLGMTTKPAAASTPKSSGSAPRK